MIKELRIFVTINLSFVLKYTHYITIKLYNFSYILLFYNKTLYFIKIRYKS